MDGKLRLETKTGSTVAETKKGQPYFRSEGIELQETMFAPTPQPPAESFA